MKISIGISPCPNDTFAFDALVNGRIHSGDIKFDVWMGDILHLNKKAMAGELDVVKISYNTFGQVIDSYQLLDSGSALGFGCGPLLITKDVESVEDLVKSGAPVAIPGRNTTANLLLGFFAPGIQNKVEMTFEKVMPAVVSGEAAAGVIIHENRFTYQDHGLKCMRDLGEYWETQTSHPIPLGAIVASRALGKGIVDTVDDLIRESVRYAFDNPTASLEYVKEHAQEMDEQVMRKHIGLYVNTFTESLGEHGMAAVRKLLEVGEDMQLFAPGTAVKLDQSKIGI